MSRKNSLYLPLTEQPVLSYLSTPHTLLPYYLSEPVSQRLGTQLSIYQLRANRITKDLQDELNSLRVEEKMPRRQRQRTRSKRKHEEGRVQKDKTDLEKYQTKIEHYQSLLEKVFRFIEENISPKVKEKSDESGREGKQNQAQLQHKVQKLAKENEQLQRDYCQLQREAQRNRNSYDEHLQSLHQQNHELYSQLEKAELEIKKCYQQLDQAKEENATMNRQIDQFEQIYRQAVNRTDYEKQQNQELKEQLQRAEHELNSYVELLAQMRNSYLHEQQSLRTATSMISGLEGIYQQKVSLSRHDPGQFQETISRLRQANQSIVKEISQKGALIQEVGLRRSNKGSALT